jgi:membrane-associated phospholipid phosphatase
MSDLRPSEILSLVYFWGLVGMSWARRVPPRDRLRVFGAAVTVSAAIASVSSLRWPAVHDMRDWLPAVLLVLAYWTPSRLVVTRHDRFERWLLDTDAALLSSRAGAYLLETGRVVRELLELSYLLVYPLIPGAFAILLAHGLRHEADRFWSVVLGAEYVCYALLPLLPARPPREADATRQRQSTTSIRSFNLWILGRVSNHWNTFPSGHVAGSFACALIVWSLLPGTGVGLLVVATGIALGSIVGRYHYVVDVLAGLAVAVVTFTIMSAWWAV